MCGSRACVRISWMCNKQAAVSHAGLHMDGLPALQFRGVCAGNVVQ